MNGSIIIGTLIIYFSLLLIIARLTRSQTTDNKEFFLGSKRAPWYAISFGMIGASLSGVSFVSVPGMVKSIDMTYLQTCIGFFVGYIVIAQVLLPLYYRLNLTSIYTYLEWRLGTKSYKTGAAFFLLSKLLGASVRLYLVCLIVHHLLPIHIPFAVTAISMVGLIWMYTYRSGLSTIIWTDNLQTFCLLLALILIIVRLMGILQLDFSSLIGLIQSSGHSRIFEFDDWYSKQHFAKQFLSGIFITIVMTGLDQDMMQKNLSCRNVKEARRNMLSYGIAFIPVNMLFLTLGILLLAAGQHFGIQLPTRGDELLPYFATGGYLGLTVMILFTIGIIAAAFSSADSAITSMTTCFCIDILGIQHLTHLQAEQRIRKQVHIGVSVLFVLCMLLFEAIDSHSLIDTIFVLASYTYGPLLGMFTFSLFTNRQPSDRLTPLIAIISPIATFGIDRLTTVYLGYTFGYELLMLNGAITFALMWGTSKQKNKFRTKIVGDHFYKCQTSFKRCLTFVKRLS